MAAFDPNIWLGELPNSPLFWIAVVGVGILALLYFYPGLLGKKKREEFKEESLTDSLNKDLKPRLKIHGKKVKNTKLMQNMISFGKVRRYTISKVKFKIRDPVIKPVKKDDPPVLKEVELKMMYFTVGGNPWLDWIPYIGKDYEPEIFVINEEFIKYDPDSRIFLIDMEVHMYPYAKIWISDIKTQKYLTELEARRTIEFEAETNINTLKRWTYYGVNQSGKVVVMEKDTQLEEQKWDNTRDFGE